MSVGDRNIQQDKSVYRAPTEEVQVDRRAGEEVKPVEVKGQYKGMEVTVEEDPHSKMADAAEELTFSLAETVERKLFDRKVSKREGQHLTAAEIEKAELLAKKLRGLNPQDLKSLLARIKQQRPSSSEDLARMTKEAFPDPTERHLALTYLKEAYTESGEDAEILAFVNTALITMEAEEGPAIRAGYNIGEVPLTDLAPAGEHREVYRENVLSFRNAGETFTNLLSSYGEQGVGKMLDYVADSLAVDMSSLSPSTDATRLGIVNDGIATARSIVTLMDDADAMLGRLADDFGANKSAKPGEIVRTLFALKDGTLTSELELKTTLPMRGRMDPTHDVEMLKGLMNIARNIPDRLFAKSSSRQDMLDVLQGALDGAIELEERLLDEEG